MPDTINSRATPPRLPYTEVCRVRWWEAVWLCAGPALLLGVIAWVATTEAPGVPDPTTGELAAFGLLLLLYWGVTAMALAGVSTVISQGHILLDRPLIPTGLAVLDVVWAGAVRYAYWTGLPPSHRVLAAERPPVGRRYCRYHVPAHPVGRGRGVLLVLRDGRRYVIASHDPDRMLAAIWAAGHTGPGA